MDDQPEVSFYSDFNCPYCYSLNERLLALGDKGRTAWRGIEHMPAADSAALELLLEENRGESGTIGYVDIDRVFKEYSGTTGAREDFLRPVGYVPEGVELERIMDLAAGATSVRPRHFLFGRGAHIPLPARLLARALFPRQPIWRLYILTRIAAKCTGLLFVTAALGAAGRAVFPRRRRPPARRAGMDFSAGSR